MAMEKFLAARGWAGSNTPPLRAARRLTSSMLLGKPVPAERPHPAVD
jgi:hypothetical protein